MDKKAVIEALLGTLDQETSQITKSRDYHRDAAIEAEGRMISRYDSTKAEMSYLADAHQTRLAETTQQISVVKAMPIKSACKVVVGALVQVSAGNEKRHYFVLPGGGGRTVCYEGISILVITHKSPLFQSMKGLEEGDEVKIANATYTISSIW